MDIHYEPHPVSPERKAELRAKGLKIVDARFAPCNDKSEPASASVPQSPDEIDGMKKAEVKEWLDAHGLETSGRVDKMRARLKSTMFVGL